MSDLTLLLLSLSLSGTVIAGLIFAVKALWKKNLSKSVLYYLWLIALVRLVLPFSFEGALLDRIYAGNSQTAVSAVTSVENATPITSSNSVFSVPAVSESSAVQIVEVVSTPAAVSAETAVETTTVPAETQTAAETTVKRSVGFMELIPYLWAAGFAAFCGFTLISYSIFTAKLKKVNRTADENIQNIAAQLGCKLKIHQNPLAKTPMLIGLFRQSIVLPDVIYTKNELVGALTHELTHKRRHDLLYKWFALFVNAIHWFNPIVWLVRREVSRDCELSCDEALIKNLQNDEKQIYGETLINLAAAHRYPAGVIATTLCEEKRTLKERLGAIMTYQKKGFKNKVMSCVLIVAVTASGMLMGACVPSQKHLAYPESISILKSDFFSYSSSDMNNAAKQQWLDEMAEHYGVQFKIYSDNKNYMESTDVSSESGATDSETTSSASEEQTTDTFTGLISVRTNSVLNSYVEYDSVMPLDEYLANNPTWNALPDDFKSLFEINGHIYAIPTSASQTYSVRIISNKALAATGLTVTDLDSFNNFAMTYLQEYGNAAIGSVSVRSTTDILNAYGLYTDYSGFTMFNYDPTADCFVDWLTKPAAIEALEYLRELYNTGVISVDYTPDYTKFENGLIASGYSQNYYIPTTFFYTEHENSTELYNLNSEYPQIIVSSVNGFAMTPDTPQPQETVNLLIDMLFGSQENYLECWLGSSDNYTLNSDGTITVNMVQNSDGDYIIPSLPSLTGGLPDIFPYSDADIYYGQDGVIDTSTDTYTGKLNAFLRQKSDAINSGEMIKIPLAYQLYQSMKSSTYYENKNAAYKLYLKYFQNAIFDSDQTVQEIVDEYRAAMLELGGNQMLDEMNAAIGKTTAYYYG
ncbi:MAG TPA: M56 family metallopeptidase [Oscillospiraceae bacterium]|nr:M56 family metallopeptidase [Oscillospiraceae bacterium]HPF56585.1 M56 family metallopeptidase [Clostridiales bacterium]HPK36341.1 M56 family metallopeptidase [Oscillospiraceae bacterium]HPR76114.1 M56 family metallopeptidase [Oscillospiraceae bacterium]